MTSSGVSDDRWPIAIGTLYEVKQQIAELEDPSLIGFSLARVRASTDQLAQVGRTVAALPPTLADWFLHADGWPKFYFDLDLLPVAEVAIASDLMDADPVLASYFEFASLPARPDNLLLSGSSRSTPHRVFVVLRDEDGAPAGTTLWLDEESIEVYPSFLEFFLSGLELHRIYFRQLRASV